MSTPAHPAPFSDALMPIFAKVLDDLARAPRKDECPRVLDPFAGIGRIHELAALCDVETIGVELEAEWAHAHPRTLVGDATRLRPSWTGRFDVVLTSPCYGNRMADKYDFNDACSTCEGSGSVEWGDGITDCPKCKGDGRSPRRTYRRFLDRDLSANSAAAMQWSDEYRELHEQAWVEVHRVLRRGGIFVLNIKDHQRDLQRVHVSAWHRRTVEALGFTRLRTIPVMLNGYRHGENHQARIDREYVYVFRRR